MKSARKIAYLKRKNRTTKPYSWIKKIILPGLIIAGLSLAFLFIKLNARYWDGDNKFAFVFPDDNGNVGVTVLDPTVDEMTTLVIPGDTEVTKNFSLPVFLWTDKNLPNLFKFVFLPGMTNIPFGDRVSIALFSFKVKNMDKTEIDLAKSQFVVKRVLTDGKTGYIIPGETSGRITVYFTDNDFIKPALVGKNIKVYIVDSTGRPNVSQEVGRIFEVMGGKVVSIDKSQGVRDFGCEIAGKDKGLVKKVVNLFGCKIVSENTDFDLEIRLGSEFSKTF
ncbi:MAG: hypothetical protein UU16_C0006G0007 [Candidatus Woesebacteria bacterium GW2011_GWA2_40_7]|uniref:Uncharacterized protein n=1 Tax=Candidatus Woesebacteria bacterium GW2011_GWA2_40_7 TaxID=1618562 RepID=A0A0G0TAN2_9BACT|nr:MAG: hypothetical protein UU16_C0006G0007 [Candidatus Woesebacteria bacterium GW2011_GWA2_40_7]